MIKFASNPNANEGSSRLVYRRDELSFDVEPLPSGCHACVVINEVQMHFNERNRVLCVTGYCPYHGWKKTQETPPLYTNGILVVTSPQNTPNGVGIGITASLGKRWPVYVNKEGWVCVGVPEERGEKVIEFAPSSVAVLKGDT